MPEFAYDTEQVRQGGSTARQASSQGESAAGTLAGATVSSSHFGDVGPAGSLAGAVEHARAAHADLARTLAQDLDVQGHRADTTAELGDDNETATSRLAPRLSNARGVADGM